MNFPGRNPWVGFFCERLSCDSSWNEGTITTRFNFVGSNLNFVSRVVVICCVVRGRKQIADRCVRKLSLLGICSRVIDKDENGIKRLFWWY